MKKVLLTESEYEKISKLLNEGYDADSASNEINEYVTSVTHTEEAEEQINLIQQKFKIIESDLKRDKNWCTLIITMSYRPKLFRGRNCNCVYEAMNDIKAFKKEWKEKFGDGSYDDRHLGYQFHGNEEVTEDDKSIEFSMMIYDTII